MLEIDAPNFEEMMELVESLAKVNAEKQKLEVDIEVGEAESVKLATTDKSLSPDGKVLSATFVVNTYKITGIHNELVPKRYELARLSAELDKANKIFKIMEMQMEAWRTEQASARKAIF